MQYNTNIVEAFFRDLSEYVQFLIFDQDQRLASLDFSCIATLKKENDKFLYRLTWKNGLSVAEYVRPFRPNAQNLQLFNAGCAEMARRLRIYLETGDISQVPTSPPAFGVLSCESPDEPPPSGELNQPDLPKKYFPVVHDARVVRRYDGGNYNVVLLTDVKTEGFIHCSHLLVAFLKGESEPSYVIAAELNNLSFQGTGFGSHFLCSYTGREHINHGCSDEWADLERFDRKSRELMSEALGITITPKKMSGPLARAVTEFAPVEGELRQNLPPSQSPAVESVVEAAEATHAKPIRARASRLPISGKMEGQSRPPSKARREFYNAFGLSRLARCVTLHHLR